MRYYVKTIVSGSVEEEIVYPAVRGTGKRLPRGRNERPTAPEQKKRNYENARLLTLRMVNLNFGKDDLIITATYPAARHITAAEAEAEWARFTRRVRAWRQRRGLPKLKWYMALKEKDGNMHHHAVLSGMSLDAARGLWTAGNLRLEHMNADEEYSALVNYFPKEERREKLVLHKHSRGLEKPFEDRRQLSRLEYERLLTRHNKASWLNVISEVYPTKLGSVRYTMRKRIGGLTAGQIKRRQAYARHKARERTEGKGQGRGKGRRSRSGLPRRFTPRNDGKNGAPASGLRLWGEDEQQSGRKSGATRRNEAERSLRGRGLPRRSLS